MKSNIIITGFMGTGKSAVAKELARKLKMEFIDMDRIIEERRGMSIADVFAGHGEKYFREQENKLVKELSKKENTVIATGGGTLLSSDNARMLGQRGQIICLYADSQTIYNRVNKKNNRPLLKRENVLSEINRLLEERKEAYNNFTIKIDTTNLNVQEVADKTITLLKRAWRAKGEQMKEIKIKITEDKEYKICIKKGILINLGEHLSKTIENKRIIIITNSLVNCLYGVKLLSSLKKGGFNPDLIDLIEIPDGEKYKSLSTAKYLYDELLKRKADRTTTLIALGGGVIGDLTGFVAATYMRGLPLVHIPTTLLAQVDSSIGGKVAVDHLLAKNIIGSFYQPKAVYTDPEVLQTLSDKDIKNGIIEAIKIAIIKSPAFFKWLEKNIDLLIKKHRDLLCELVKEAVSLKADIVLKDPRERCLRKVLNFGHSIGHVLEVGAGYEDLSHGEAVALGMLIETKIARNRGICSEEFEEKIKKILSFLTSSPSSSRKRESIFKDIKNIDYNQFWETLSLDKKNEQGRMTFILPETLGKVSLIDNISKEEVIKALEEFKKEWSL